MASELYSTFLATRIVHSQEAITYRLLSRELKIHTALAKRYLYAFHCSSKSIYPDKVHATYLISGQKRPATTASGDVLMSDVSSPPSTLPDTDVAVEEEIVQTAFELVPEEELEDMKSTFRKIAYVHVYSLEPARLPEDFISLAECGRKVRDIDLEEDPHTISQTYGVIAEPAAKRQPLGQLASAQSKPAAILTTKTKAPHTEPEVKQRPPSKPSTMSSPLPPVGKTDRDRHFKPKATTEVEVSSKDIKKEKRESPPIRKLTSPALKSASTPSTTIKKTKSGSPTSRSSSQASQELQSMFSSSEDENDKDEREDIVNTEAETPKDVIGAIHESFISDDINLSIDKTPAKPKDTNIKSEDVEMESAPMLEGPGESITNLTLTKRAPRRGRRKVTKPIHTKDANGFLTTKYEELWESYSEASDEEPSATRLAGPVKRSSSPVPKKEKDMSAKKENGSKKKTASSGQSSLMSFWKK
ncbi:DNA polymerase subunit Cdc27 [Lipomyces kononenkoae]